MLYDYIKRKCLFLLTVLILSVGNAWVWWGYDFKGALGNPNLGGLDSGWSCGWKPCRGCPWQDPVAL